ncbi:DNA polymerase I [Vulcanisaeta sp. EB80]|jgi:DNA polymerase I|uniref:DNA-directed DNA polymerase I n=1 Tax=Vulcanisaeta sp. EB80 TaxID=1650660 RepID=UPI0009BCF9EC|nr:DNA-directed DNA polymerase I [Vulcanisaeta sp. EB80]MCG2866011.1 DNA-directed DNA polymerase I [Vulcanisaeta sp.]MCG2884890.1 DNA-directed DNA polymerase I [Vulcanisaeta sp.]PLC68356.1 DNA polymerase I [Vulcanisaeta sp. EB80]
MKARDIEEEEEEEEVEEEVEELEEEEEEISIKAETPQNTPPSIVLAVTYDGKVGKALVKLYDPVNDRVYFWYDNTGHKPYLLTDVKPEELITKFTKVILHPGFSHLEAVEKYDALNDRKVILTKICAKDPLSIGGKADSIRELLPKTWESRIRYHLCYIFDNEIIPGMFYRIEDGKLVQVPIEVPSEVEDFVKKLYANDPDFLEEASRWIPLFQAPVPSIKRLSIDIEVFTPQENRVPNPREANYEIISIGLAGSDGLRKVLVLRRPGMELRPEDLDELLYDDVEVEFFNNEYDMLREFFSILLQYPILITFNGDNFDLPYIYHRALKLGFKKEEIPITIRRNEASIALGVHIDLYKFFNIRAIEVYAFGGKYRGLDRTLDTIAHAIVGMSKLNREKTVSQMTYVELINYNFRDAFLGLYLTTYDDNLVLRLIILMSRISKTPPDDLVRSQISAWIRNMLYYEHRRRGWLIPEKEDIIKNKGEVATKAIIKGKKYAGAIVLDPMPGIYPNVYVLDFASMYPSVIKRWNISYETVKCPDEKAKNNKPIPELPHWVCNDRRGLTALIVGLLRDLRAYVYKRLAKTAPSAVLKSYYNVVQSALKVFINASYGVLGAEIFQLYCPPAAELTTALARYVLSRTVLKALELGLVPIYGDTDSLFIWNPSEEKLKELIDWVEKEFGIEIELDKVYRLIAMSGRKKNYVGILSDGELDIKGLVGKKRNTPDFAKDAFNDVLRLLSDIRSLDDVNKSIEEVRDKVRDYYRKLQRREIPLNKLAIRTALTKPLESYTKNTPQHVKAALQLKNLGYKLGPGDIIIYVKTTGKDGVKPIQLARIDEIDPNKYIEYLRTSLEQVLDAFGIEFESIMGSSIIDNYSS